MFVLLFVKDEGLLQMAEICDWFFLSGIEGRSCHQSSLKIPDADKDKTIAVRYYYQDTRMLDPERESIG